MRKSVEPRSGRPVRRMAALLALWILGSASVSFAMPVGGEEKGNPKAVGLSAEDRALIEERERMREEYRELREKRLRALKAAVEETSGDPTGGQVPGWKSESTGRGPAARRTGGTGGTLGGPGSVESGTESGDPAAAAPVEDSDHTVLVVIGGGILLGLLLRVLRPSWFLNGFLPFAFRRRVRRREPAPKPGKHEPMTLTLKPRDERTFR
jgi:hypothetical protein